MPTLSCFVTDDTMARLEQEAADLGRKVDDLAECAIEESVRTVRLRPAKPVCPNKNDPDHDAWECPACLPF